MLLFVYWSAIASIYHANLANLNFGIVSSCFIVSVVVNTTANRILFKDSITLKMGFGITVTLSGIIWVSLAKGQDAIKIKVAAGSDLEPTEDEIFYHKVMSIILALTVGVGNACSTIHSRLMREWERSK